ncbi:MAG: hypothetical protein HY898_37070 [Deltaproteobacteria bacterium]|nr:hypothetical protein [Deltaproteobacteria bacterium]
MLLSAPLRVSVLALSTLALATGCSSEPTATANPPGSPGTDAAADHPADTSADGQSDAGPDSSSDASGDSSLPDSADESPIVPPDQQSPPDVVQEPPDPGCPTTPPVASAAMGSHFDPAVFDPAYYLCRYPDVAASFPGEARARLHWLMHGMQEGRQAQPAFSVDEYLAMYPDLAQAFGSDRPAAVLHYVHYGLKEGRKGTQAGLPNAAASVGQDLRPQGGVSYDPSSKAANAIIDTGSSVRMAGGIDHLGWNAVEFINNFDHGRELQIAWSADGFGECFNPTECGSSTDGTGAVSSSALHMYWTSGSLLGSEVRPAFWLPPNTVQYCGPVHNTTVTADHILNKIVQVGYGGIQHVVRFLVQVTIPEDLTAMTIEAPTGYLTGAFSSFYTIDLPAGVLAPLSAGPGEQSLPVILSKPDGSAAMGAWSPDLPQAEYPGAGYGRFAFPDPGNAANATNKWNVVFRRSATPAGVYDFRGFAIVGTLENVRVAMTQLYGIAK